MWWKYALAAAGGAVITAIVLYACVLYTFGRNRP